jgi:hypothetical protein
MLIDDAKHVIQKPLVELSIELGHIHFAKDDLDIRVLSSKRIEE